MIYDNTLHSNMNTTSSTTIDVTKPHLVNVSRPIGVNTLTSDESTSNFVDNTVKKPHLINICRPVGVNTIGASHKSTEPIDKLVELTDLPYVDTTNCLITYDTVGLDIRELLLGGSTRLDSKLLELLASFNAKHPNTSKTTNIELLFTCHIASIGDMKAMKWARKNKCYWNCGTACCVKAAENGHIKMLKWLRKWGANWCCDVIDSAIRGSHIDILTWCHKHGCPVYTSAYLAAINNNNPYFLQWCKDNIKPINNSSIIDEASGRGDIELMNWLKANGCQIDHTCFTRAMMSNNEKSIKWCQDNNCILSSYVYYKAIEYNNFELLKWLESKKSVELMINTGHANKNGIKSDILVTTARHGKLNMLEYLVDNCSYVMDSRIIPEAAMTGNLAIIKYAISKGIKPDEISLINAANAGHLDILIWLTENTDIKLTSNITRVASAAGHNDILAWAVSKGVEWSENSKAEYLKRINI